MCLRKHNYFLVTSMTRSEEYMLACYKASLNSFICIMSVIYHHSNYTKTMLLCYITMYCVLFHYHKGM